jgi:putative ABC transport system ATP-binding protein
MIQTKAKPTSTDVVARLKNASKIYGKDETQVKALNNVSAEFKKGVFTAIMGPSGSGKSTLLQCLAGLDTITEGSVIIGDVELNKINDRDLTILRREKVGFIFQSFNLIPTLNARENILLPMTIAKRKHDEAYFDELTSVLGLTDRLKHIPSEMSGGQQQRVAAARALISRPDLIFADEPSGNLDSKSGAKLLGFLRKAVTDYDQAIVMVTHDVNVASYADRIIFLDDGKIVDEMTKPTPEKVLDRLKKLGE